MRLKPSVGNESHATLLGIHSHDPAKFGTHVIMRESGEVSEGCIPK